MPRLDVFDPPMCCPTGLCGPSVDPLLAAFAADAEWLASQGVTVVRHNLAQEPGAFVENAIVSAALRDAGDAALPLLLIDGTIVSRAAYPRRAELARLLGLTPAASTDKRKITLAAGGGCTPGSGCC